MSEKTKRRKKSDAPVDEELLDEERAGGRRISSRLIAVLVAVAAFAFVIYSVISLIGIQAQINERRKELEELKGEITVQEIKNEEMSRIYNLSDAERSDYIERIARDELDYVKEGERVFVNVSGD